MKVRVTIKDPDVLDDSVLEAVEESANGASGLDADERRALVKRRATRIRDELVEKWVEYGEYYVIEFDTDEGTAVVIPRNC